MTITWDEARKLIAEWDERAWNSRTTEVKCMLTCPECFMDCEGSQEVTGWDAETLEPNMDTLNAPEAWCETCEHILLAPYDIVHTEPGCCYCHDPIWCDECYEEGKSGKIYCDESCREMAGDEPEEA